MLGLCGCTGFGCGVQASCGRGFSGRGVQALGLWASAVAARRLSSSGPWVSLPGSTWDPPGPGGELVSLALQDGFLTTGRPGKPSISVLTVPGTGQTPPRSLDKQMND